MQLYTWSFQSTWSGKQEGREKEMLVISQAKEQNALVPLLEVPFSNASLVNGLYFLKDCKDFACLKLQGHPLGHLTL